LLTTTGWPDGRELSGGAVGGSPAAGPSLGGGAAAGGVVAGELGAAAVGGAVAGVTKDPHQRLGAAAPAFAVRHHNHAWLVLATEAGQTLPSPSPSPSPSPVGSVHHPACLDKPRIPRNPPSTSGDTTMDAPATGADIQSTSMRRARLWESRGWLARRTEEVEQLIRGVSGFVCCGLNRVGDLGLVNAGGEQLGGAEPAGLESVAFSLWRRAARQSWHGPDPRLVG
jgi:hypothetical protein